MVLFSLSELLFSKNAAELQTVIMGHSSID